MVSKIQGKKLSKRTNNKQGFKKFVDSDYTDLDAFKKACKGDENLLIYTCLKHDELQEYIEKIKAIPDLNEQIKFLKNNQPPMNETEERFDVCIESIAVYLKNYITYNGFIMNNGSGDAEDWASEFWLKYAKICKFYKDRWFHPENLKKASTVEYHTMLYKEFIYICRMSITGERRHQAFLATQKPEASIFKPSLDFGLDNKSNANKSLMDIVTDNKNGGENILEDIHAMSIQEKAIELSKKYENGKYAKQIEAFYLAQDASGFDKKVVVLGKIFLYKAGLVAPKTLAFVKSLSNTYKAKFNISNALINRQMSEFKKKKSHRICNYSEVLEDGGKTRVGLLLRRRGATE